MNENEINDRELLFRAATAAGLLVQKNVSCVDADDRFIGIKVRATYRDRYSRWNALTDDGDALRLAAKLGISVSYSHSTGLDVVYPTITQVGAFAGWCPTFTEVGATDWATATRRAIVRAAAALEA